MLASGVDQGGTLDGPPHALGTARHVDVLDAEV
jgi:hypothetical protein